MTSVVPVEVAAVGGDAVWRKRGLATSSIWNDSRRALLAGVSNGDGTLEIWQRLSVIAFPCLEGGTQAYDVVAHTMRDLFGEMQTLNARVAAVEARGVMPGVMTQMGQQGMSHTGRAGPVVQSSFGSQMGGPQTMPFQQPQQQQVQVGIGGGDGAGPPGLFDQTASRLNLENIDHESSMGLARGTTAVAEVVSDQEKFPEKAYAAFEDVIARECGVFGAGPPWSREKHAGQCISGLADKHRCWKRTFAITARIYELQRHYEHNPAVARAFTARTDQVMRMAAAHVGHWEVGWDLLGMKDPLQGIKPRWTTSPQVAVVAVQRERTLLAEAIQKMSKGASSSSGQNVPVKEERDWDG
jgi:hypothetical protein